LCLFLWFWRLPEALQDKILPAPPMAWDITLHTGLKRLWHGSLSSPGHPRPIQLVLDKVTTSLPRGSLLLGDMENSGHGDSISDGVTVFPVSVFLHQCCFVFLLAKKSQTSVYSLTELLVMRSIKLLSFLGSLLHTLTSACGNL